MNKQIKEILEDIYLVDDSLKKHERDLQKIVEKLLKSKPDAKLDDKFIKNLKEEVMRNIEEVPTFKLSKNTGFKFFSFSKLIYTGAGIAVFVLVFVAGANFDKLNIKTSDSLKGFKLAQDSSRNKIAFSSEARKLSSNAFGSISALDQPGSARDESAKSFDGGGALNQMAESKLAMGSEEASTQMISPDRFMIPERIRYDFVYKGDDFELLDETLNVYRRNKNSATNKDLAKYITNADFDIFDLSSLENTEVTNLSISEDKEFGLSAYFNFKENSLSLNTNWSKWPRPDSICRDNECFEKFRIKISDVPSDSKIIKVANSFVEGLNIDISNYAEPEVQDNWREHYNKIQDKKNAYIPEQITVIYPLLVEGKNVYERGGVKTGLFVNVNIRYSKVAGLREITPKTYEASSYEAETNIEKILNFAGRGGLNKPYSPEKPTKTVVVEFSNPERVILKNYKFNSDTGDSEELYVPALKFPITKLSDNTTYFYHKAIIVPLITDMLNGNNNSGGTPEPMPLMRGSIEPMIEPIAEPEPVLE